MGGTELVYELFAECRTGGPNSNTKNGICVLDPSNFKTTWPTVQAILVAMVVKAGLTVVTFGIKVPAGIFIPTLGVGACAGRLLGVAVKSFQWRHPEHPVFAVCKGDMECVIPGLYAMVGGKYVRWIVATLHADFASFSCCGVIWCNGEQPLRIMYNRVTHSISQRTTVSLAVIMFELTDTLTYAVPVMLAVLVAKTVADALEPKGIYDLVIEYETSSDIQKALVLMPSSRLNQLPFLDVKTEYIWGSYQVNDVVSALIENLSPFAHSVSQTDREVPVIRADGENTVHTLRDQLQNLLVSGHDDGGFPILSEIRDTDEKRLVGYIGANELEHALSTFLLIHLQQFNTDTCIRHRGRRGRGRGLFPHKLRTQGNDGFLCVLIGRWTRGDQSIRFHRLYGSGEHYVIEAKYFIR